MAANSRWAGSRAGARVGINGRDQARVQAAAERGRRGGRRVGPGDAAAGVTVNCVIAGPTHTEGVENFVYELVGRDVPWDEARRTLMRQHRPQSLLQRLIEPEEIANVVVYLSSDLASATTGGALRRNPRASTQVPVPPARPFGISA